MKVSDASYGFIMEEMRNQDALESDTNRVYVNGEESDKDEEESGRESNDKEEEE